jgi:hypothetical protein
MKNIFLLPTDKPSYLFIIDKSKMFVPEAPYLSYSTVGGRVHKTEGSDIYRPHFIYITNAEKFKKDEWVTDGIEVIKASSKVVDAQGLVNRRDWRKVALTNDTSLIEDGVQQVSSSFLSFYAENPVDYVRVEKWLDDEGKKFYSLNFPPKEIKTEEKCKGSFKDCFKTLNECTCGNIIDNWLEKNGNPEISKQVEREAELYPTINKIIDGGKNLPKGFEVSRGQAIDYAFDVALEVAEKMYSEEDLHNAFYNGWIYRGENYTFPKAKKEWLEQFKNR